MRRYASMALGAAVAAAALVPLYGDIRSVSHPEWARMLVRAIHPSEVLDATPQASQVFAMLSGRESVSYRVDRYHRAEKIAVHTRGRDTCVSGDGTTGEVAFRVGVARAGHYRVRARLEGSPSAPVVAQLATFRDAEPVATYDVVPAPVFGWTDARARPGAARRLSPGGYVASFLVPPQDCLAQVEIVPPCLRPIEPAGGWQPRAVTQTSDVAVTVLKALDLEWELPPAAGAVEYAGSDFEVDESAGQALAIQAAAGPEMSWLRGAAGGTRALLVVTVPEDGLYTFSALGRFATAQRWGLDSCVETLLCPTADKEGLRWRAITTMQMMAGRHMLSVELPPDGVVARTKVERKKASVEDYRAALARLGLDVGEEAPVTRRGAADAVSFLKSRAQGDRDLGLCRDVEFGFPPAPGERASTNAGDSVALLQPAQPPPPAPPQAPGGLPPIAPPAVDPGNRSTPPPPDEPEPDVVVAPTTTPPVLPTPTPPTPTPPTPRPPTPTPPTPTPPTPTPPTPVPTPPCASPPCPP